MTHHNTPVIRRLGLCHYQPIWEAMKTFTQNRTPSTPDEIWVLEHYPVLTQGPTSQAEHIIDAGSIPVVSTDRGGQVTYHGPGQLILYLLLDLKRHSVGIRQLVAHLEQAVIDLLKEHYHIEAYAREEARGVYVGEAKICSIGLRVSRHSTYHGLALNVNMDTSPFSRITPCGQPGLAVTQLAQWDPTVTVDQAATALIYNLLKIVYNR